MSTDPDYLEEAAALLRKAQAANEGRSGQFGTGQAVNEERLRIAEDLIRIAAIQHGADSDGPAPDARIAAVLRFATYTSIAETPAHFLWIIDQMVRVATGCPEDATMAGLGTSPAYERFRDRVGEWSEGELVSPVTDTERLSWQFRALALAGNLLDRAIAEHLPPLQWTIGITGELRGQVVTGGDRRQVFTRWRDALGNPDEDLEQLDGTRLRAVWNSIERVRLILAADLRDGEEQP